MKGRSLVASLLVLVLLSGNLVAGAADVPDPVAAPNPPQRTMSLTFDARPERVSFLGSVWDTFRIEGCQQAYGAGGPDIPVKVVRLELPGPLERLEVDFAGKTAFESVRLAPVGPDYLFGLDMLDPTKPLVDTGLYSKDRLLPAVDHQLFKLGEGLNGQGERTWFYELQLYPLRYNPARGTAVLQRECELALYYESAPAPLPERAWDGVATPYVIITSTAVNASGALAPLVAWKTKKGLPAMVFEVPWIEANYPGFDTPEKIRNFLMQRFLNPYLMQWLLLVGDNNTVPTRLVKNPSPVLPFDDASIPADSYYGCLDTDTTWDAAGSNHIYGEFFDNNFDGLYDGTDLDDAIQDVWVGRFASSDTARISTWVQNVVNYEKATSPGAWMNSCTLIAPNAGAIGTAMQTAAKMEEYINKTVQGYYGYLGAYYGKVVSGGSINRLYEQTGTLSRPAIIGSVNTGFAFGTWISQGDAAGISSPTAGTLFTSADVAGLTNGARKPVIFAMSSSAGRFDDQECLGEVLTENNLNNGAIGFVGASRVTSGTASAGYPTGGLGNGTAIQMDFLYQMQLGKQFDATLLYMGKTLGYAKRGYRDVQIDQNAGIFIHDYTVKAFYEYNLLGEPNCPVWTDTATSFNPQTSVSEDASFKNVSIRVRNAMTNSAANHTLVCLEYGPAGFYGYAETSIDGWANFSIPKGMMLGNVTITRADFTPFEYAEVPLDDTYPPYTDIIVTPAIPDGRDNWYKSSPTIRLIPESGVTTYFRWDSDAEQTYSGGVMSPPEGEHTLHFRSVDWKGNREGEKSLTFKVDSLVPNTTVTVTPAEPDGENGWYVTRPEVRLSNPGDTGSPIQIKYKVDAEPDFADYTGAIVVEERQHTLKFYSQDYAGNKEKEQTLTLKVDTVLPSSLIRINPATPDGQHGWYLKEPSITFYLDDLNSPFIRYSWDGGPPENLSATGTLHPPQGIHNLTYQAVDEAGNAEEARNQSFKLDSQTPVTNLSLDPALPDGMNGWYVTRPTLVFDTGGPDTVRYKWNEEPYVCATGPLLVPEGINTLTYYATDDAGNKENAKFAAFKVDTSVPVTTITVTPADKGDDWYTKRPKVKLSNTENCTINYYWGTDIANVQKYVREFEVPEGRELLHYWSIDEAGNKEAEVTKIFNVDSLPPSVSFTADPVSVTVGGTVAFELKGTDQNGVTDYYVDFGDGNNTGWIQSLTASHAYGMTGNFTVTCKGRDPAGNEAGAAPKVIEVKPVYVPPVVNPPKKEEGPNWMLIGGAVGLLVIVGAVAAAAMMRRKPKDDFFIKEEREKQRIKETMPAYDFAAGRTDTPSDYAAGAIEEPAAATGAAAAAAYAAPSEESRTFSCPKCSNEVEKGAEYCYTCGERFKKGGPGGPGGQPGQPAAPAYVPEQPAAPAYEQAPAQPAYEAPAQPVYEAPAQPVYEAPARPAYQAPERPAPAAPPVAGGGELDDIMKRLESISTPAAAGVAARPAPPAGPAPHPVPRTPPPAPRPTPPAPHAPHPAPGTPHPATASAATGTGRMCPKCGAEMARLLDLPGAQGEQLRKLQSRGQHAFQCRNCNHFEIAPWKPAA